MYSHAANGIPVSDGFRIFFDESYFPELDFVDALVFEKTDSNDSFPDGGFAFVNRGMNVSTDNAVAAMVIRGNGKVGIGPTNPSEKLEVDGTVKATAFVGNGSGLEGVVQSEADPTVVESVKDGVSWSELSDIPSGFADDVDDVLESPFSGDLTVNGVVESTIGGFRFPDGSAQTTAAPPVPTAVAFHAYRSIELTVPDNNTMDFAANVEEFDTHSYYDTTSFRFTPQQEGYYFLYASMHYEQDGSVGNPTRIVAFLFKNDQNVAESQDAITNESFGFNNTVSISRALYLNGTTDFVTFHTRQSSFSPSDETVTEGGITSFVGGYLIGSTQ